MTHTAAHQNAGQEDLVIHSQVVGDRRLIALSGPLDAANAPLLATALHDLARHHSGTTVDLSAVTFLATAGLQMLIEASKEFATAGHDLTLTGVGRRIRHLLQLTGDDQRLHLEPSDHP